MSRGLQRVALIAAGVVVISISVATGYWWAKHPGQTDNAMADAPTAANGSGKVLYWYDPMAPSQHFDKPGKSPFMDMQLQPKLADEGGGEAAGLRIDPGTQQNLGIRLAPVERRPFNTAIDAVGTIGFNERELAIVQARTNGFVSRVYARAPGDVVARGAPLVDLLVPEWAGAQREFIALRRSGDASLATAARGRLKLLGMPEEMIHRLEQNGEPQTTATISAPIAGVIQTLNARAGMTIATGMTLAEINALSTVWLTVAVPETLGQQVVVGDILTARFPAFAGEVIEGRVIAVLPQTNADSRTFTVRAELPNRDGRLRPGQYAQITLRSTQNAAVLSIPSEAVIRSGAHNVVILAAQHGFQPVDVATGRESGGRTEILSGLQEGTQVVASGQFLIDSEANLTGVLSRMNDGTKKTATTAAPLYETIGTIEAIDNNQITLSHQPVPALGWGAMTMSFKLARSDLTQSFKTADRVKFCFRQNGDDFVIERLEKLAPVENRNGIGDMNAMKKSGDGQ